MVHGMQSALEYWNWGKRRIFELGRFGGTPRPQDVLKAMKNSIHANQREETTADLQGVAAIAHIQDMVKKSPNWDTKHGNVIAAVKMMIGVALGETLDDSIEGRLAVGLE